MAKRVQKLHFKNSLMWCRCNFYICNRFCKGSYTGKLLNYLLTFDLFLPVLLVLRRVPSEKPEFRNISSRLETVIVFETSQGGFSYMSLSYYVTESSPLTSSSKFTVFCWSSAQICHELAASYQDMGDQVDCLTTKLVIIHFQWQTSGTYAPSFQE